MQRIILVIATISSVLALGALVFQPWSTAAPAPEVDELEFVVHTAGGEPLKAHFLVAADSEEDATRAARAAIRTVHPGATLEHTDHEHDQDGASRALGDEEDAPVNAQWGSWGWSWEADEIPVPVGYNPDGALGGMTEDDIASALDTWSGVEGSAFSFDYTGATDREASMNTSGEDGANVIAWQDLGCDGGCVLGLTTKSFDSHEVDISLNTNEGARLHEGAYDIMTVLVHELGHMAGLEHSCPALGPCTDDEADAVMFYSYNGVRHELNADDIAGLADTYPAGVTSSAPLDEEDDGERSDSSDEGTALHIEVESGWNLQSLPASSVTEVVESLGCVDAVYTYDRNDGWSHWVRGLDASLQTLGQSGGGGAYWFLASDSCSAFYH